MTRLMFPCYDKFWETIDTSYRNGNFELLGDLTSRKLVPALFNLSVDGLLPEHFYLIDMEEKRFRKINFVRL